MLSDVQTENSDAQNEKLHTEAGDVQTQKPLILKSIDDKKEFPKETQMVMMKIV